MILTLYKFSKKSNSTAIPGSGVTSLSCGEIYPKDKTSLESPVFQIDDDPSGYTYAKWGNYYYYINDIVYSTPIYEVHCTMDYEATNRSAILSYAPYVTRGIFTNSSLKDDMIPDPYITMSQEIGAHIDITSSILFTKDTDGCYVLGISNMSGGVSYQLCTRSQLAKLISFATSDDSTISQLIVNGFLNPIQFVTSCVWYPMASSAIPSISDPFAAPTFGPWPAMDISTQTPIVGVEIPDKTVALTDITISPTATYSDFRDCSAGWSSALLRLFGQTISIDPKYLQNDILIKSDLDTTTGQVMCKIYSKSGTSRTLITSVTAQFGVQIPLTQASNNAGQVLTSVMSTIASIASENYTAAAGGVGSAVAGAAGISNVINGNTGNITIALDSDTILLEITRHASCDSPEARVGYPINKSNILSGLSYAQCMNPNISISGSEAARNNINATLSSGIWLE